MRKLCYTITATLVLWGCNRSTVTDQQQQTPSKTDSIAAIKTSQLNSAANLRNFFTLADAIAILGEPAHTTDSTMTTEGNTTTYKSAYTANITDHKTNKTGVVYFLSEQYDTPLSAHNVYASIKKSNEGHGITTLHDLGDEAYYHTDGENFYFIMARKGARMFRIKVNKITGNTSSGAFNRISKRIANNL